MTKKKQVTLEISGSEELSEGVFRTTLTHPLLDGKLTFLHSSEKNRDEMLKTLTSTWKDEASNIISLVGDIEELLVTRKERQVKREKRFEDTGDE